MGRKKYSITTNESVAELCERLGVNPAEEMIKMTREQLQLTACPHCKKVVAFKPVDGKAMVDMLDPKEKINVLSELLQYKEPKKRAVEVQGQVNHSITINLTGRVEPKAITVETAKELGSGE